MIRDSFLDIIKHTSGLGFIELVKITGSEDDLIVEAIDEERSVVITGKLKEPIPGLEGTVGLSRIPVLSGYLNFKPFADEEASIEIESQERNGIYVPAEISFNSNAGHTSAYRFMSPEIANDQIKIPPFKGAVWNVTIEPERLALRDLSSLSSILGGFESTFAVTTNSGNLDFHIGSGSSDRTKLTFARDIEGSLTHTWSWPLVQVLAVLKLHGSSAACTMSFSDQGALKVNIDSGLGEYQYIFPARSQ